MPESRQYWLDPDNFNFEPFIGTADEVAVPVRELKPGRVPVPGDVRAWTGVVEVNAWAIARPHEFGQIRYP